MRTETLADARELEQILNAYADIDPAFPRWLRGGDDGFGMSYCADCAARKVIIGEAECVDGGYRAMEEDSCCHCYECGELLDYVLTEHGVLAELDHFRRQRFRRGISQEEAFHIARILEAAPESAEAIRLGRRAVAKITQSAVA